MHRVVAFAFLGPCPDGWVVNHLDRDKLNNALSNLEYVSPRENCMHALRTRPRRRGPTKPEAPLKGRPTGDNHWSRRDPSRVARGERMGASKLKEADIRIMREMRTFGMTMQKIAESFGVCVAQVSRILGGARWAHVT